MGGLLVVVCVWWWWSLAVHMYLSSLRHALSSPFLYSSLLYLITLPLHLISTNTYLFSRFRSPRRSLAGRSRVFPGRLTFVLRNNAHSEKVCSSPIEKGEPPGRLT